MKSESKSIESNSTINVLTYKNKKKEPSKFEILREYYKNFDYGKIEKNKMMEKIKELGFKERSNLDRLLENKNFNFKKLVQNLEMKKENNLYKSEIKPLDLYYTKKNPKEKLLKNNNVKNEYQENIGKFYKGQIDENQLKSLLGNKFFKIEKELKNFKENNVLDYTSTLKKLMDNNDSKLKNYNSTRIEDQNIYNQKTRIKRKQFEKNSVKENLNYINEKTQNIQKNKGLEDIDAKHDNGNFINWDKIGKLNYKEERPKNINETKLNFLKNSTNYYFQKEKNIDSFKKKDIRDFKGYGNIITWN